MAITLYNISLFAHIFFVATWLFTIPIMALLDRAANKVEAISEKYKILGMASVNAKISIGSAILVFIFGAIMTQIAELWAPDGSYWLVTKQTLWLILLIASGVLMKPLNDKMHSLMAQGEEVYDEVMAAYKKLKIRGHILTTIIVINIFLATTKPF